MKKITIILTVALMIAAAAAIGYLLAQKTIPENNFASTTQQLQLKEAELEAITEKLHSAESELQDISSRCPPRFFNDITELDKWIDTQPKPTNESSDAVQWLDRALEQQKAALNDGYIINVELWTDDAIYYSIDCAAMLQDGSYYWWDPDINEIYYWLDYRHF